MTTPKFCQQRSIATKELILTYIVACQRVNGRDPNPKQIALVVGKHTRTVRKYLFALEREGTLTRNTTYTVKG